MMHVRQLRCTIGINLAMCLLALAALPGDSAADTPLVDCDKQKAKLAYAPGFKNQVRGKCDEAIPDLEKAVELCPVPPKDFWLVPVDLFGLTSYLPFFYLGHCHYEKKEKDAPKALRQLYLSSCFGEPARDEKKMKELVPLTDKCRLWMNKQGPVHFFREGFDASGEQKWQESAEKMWDALQVLEENGRPVNSYGRWTEPYLPRFRLAAALFELGCPQQACKELDRSLLKRLRGDQVKEELRWMEELRPLCEPKKLAGQKEEEICQHWQCWLGKKGAP